MTISINTPKGIYHFNGNLKQYCTNPPDLNDTCTVIKIEVYIIAMDIFGNSKNYSCYYKTWI